MDFFGERLRRRPEPAHLPLRPVRADRPEAPDGSLRHARGRGRCAPARRRPRRPASRGAPVAARLGRELLDQEDGGVLRLRARDRPSRRRFEHRGVRGVARARRGRSARRRPSRTDRALQPRRRREQPPTARLARDPARRVGVGQRPDGPSSRRARRRCPRRSPRPRRGSRPSSIAWPIPRSSRPIRRIAAPSSTAGGCSPSSSAGIGARTRPCGGSSTASSDSRRSSSSRRTRPSAGWCRSGPSTSQVGASRRGATPSPTRTTTWGAATCTTRPRRRSRPEPVRSHGTPAR